MVNFFRGTATAMITPFTQTGVNYDALERMIEFQIENGTDALLILGTTGEPATMTEAEKEEVMRFSVKKIAGRAKVIFGSGSNSTAHAVEASIKAEALGADGLLAVTPYYNKCTQNGLVAHYTAIADAVNIPLVLYNVPTRTGVRIQPSTALRLSEHPNITAIKDASENVDDLLEMCRLCRGKLDIYSGNDSYTVFLMALGAIGVVSVVANVVPDRMVAVTNACFAGDYAKARELAFELDPLAKALFCEVNPIPTKKALEYIGIKAGKPRMPLTEIEPAHAEMLRKTMIDLGIIK